MKVKWDLGLKGGIVIGNPIPEEYELDFDQMNDVIEKALKKADEQGIRGKFITPFVLSELRTMTDGVSFASNLELAYNNIRLAGRIASAYAKEMKNVS